jgi:hypothetical protein
MFFGFPPFFSLSPFAGVSGVRFENMQVRKAPNLAGVDPALAGSPVPFWVGSTWQTRDENLDFCLRLPNVFRLQSHITAALHAIYDYRRNPI